VTCGNGQKHALTRDDATCQRSSIRVISQQNASYARPGTRGVEGPRTRTQPIIRTVRADVGNPHADVPIWADSQEVSVVRLDTRQAILTAYARGA
jgi:hypothetical protein